MPLPSVDITLGQGGLGQSGQSFDKYSSMIAYYKESAAISAYSTIGDKVYNSVADAEADGVVNTCAEATGATSIQLFTNVGADGDTVVITFETYDGTIIDLGTYTKTSAETTVTLAAAAYFAAINAKTYIHGFTAAAGTAGQAVITAPKSLGIWPNTKSVVNTITGTIAITNNAFSGGTKSWLRIWHYQISEYFRKNASPLFFSIKFDDSANNVAAFNTQLKADIASVSAAWNGKARRFGILSNGRTFATSTLDAIKQARTTLLGLKMPASFWFVGDNSGTALSAQPNLSALSDDGVHFIAGQSGSGVGYEMSKTQMQVIGSVGLAIGCKASGAISQSIAEVGAFNLSDGTECETPVFLDGTAFSIANSSLNDQLNDYGYIFLRKFPDATGTYFSNSVGAVAPSSDYKYAELVETIDKAVRGVYANILPLLNARNTLNSDGTLSVQSREAYKSAAGYALTQMFIDGDISQDPSTNGGIVVSSTEIVSQTSNIPITISLIPRGYGRKISITIGFVASI